MCMGCDLWHRLETAWRSLATVLPLPATTPVAMMWSVTKYLSTVTSTTYYKSRHGLFAWVATMFVMCDYDRIRRSIATVLLLPATTPVGMMWSVTKYLTEDISVNTTINPLGNLGNPWKLELGTKRDDRLCPHWQYLPLPTTTCAAFRTHK